jgi:hypothetical protein
MQRICRSLGHEISDQQEKEGWDQRSRHSVVYPRQGDRHLSRGIRPRGCRAAHQPYFSRWIDEISCGPVTQTFKSRRMPSWIL